MIMNYSVSSYERIIAERIIYLCKERDISINKLAVLSGIRQSTLQNIVAGNTKNPTVKTLNKIARGLGVTLSEFLKIPELEEYVKE